jgi:putative ABC transport system permease protein
MSITELLKLAWKALVTNKMRSILTTLGIIIGVFSIILLVSLGSGLQKYITSQISSLGSNLIFVIPGAPGGGRGVGGVITNKLLLSDATKLQIKLKSLALVTGFVQQVSGVKYKNKVDKGTTIAGASYNYPDVVNIALDTGTFFTQTQERSGSRVAIIGHTVVDKLFPGENPIGKIITVGSGRYTVIGVVEKRGSIFGLDQDNVVGIPITVALRQFGITNISTIYMRAKDPTLVPLVEKEATQLLLRRLTQDDFNLQTQETALSTVTNVTNILSIALGGIAAISLLVGGIGVANIMLVSVTERTREIGLRKALGAKRKDILYQFLLEAVMLSVAGGVIGIALGIGASLLISMIFVSEVTPWSIFLAFFFSILVGVVFGMAPAIKASKLSPIEALRYE